MQGIYFLLSLIAVFAVIHWLLLFDGKGDDGAYRGLLAMKPPVPAVKRRKRALRKQWQHPAEREAAPETPDP